MRFVFIILVFTAITLSCKKSKTNNCEGPVPDCSTIRCAAHWTYLNFKLIDKTTGADLVFGANPRYNINDLKLFSNAARTIPVQLNSDNPKKRLYTMTATPEMYLEINGTDVYELTAEFRVETCCTDVVKNLWQDGKMICSCCSDIIQLAVN